MRPACGRVTGTVGTVDEVATGGPGNDAGAAARRAEQQAEDEIVGLPWDDEFPVALGEDVAVAEAGPSGGLAGEASPQADDTEELLAEAGSTDDSRPGGELGDHDAEHDAGDDMGELSRDHVAGRRNALPRRVESWRSRSATGAIATAIAMGLQQVFEPERRRPAAVAEAPSDPYDDDDPITVDYVPDDAEGTTVHVKPWLLQKGEPG